MRSIVRNFIYRNWSKSSSSTIAMTTTAVQFFFPFHHSLFYFTFFFFSQSWWNDLNVKWLIVQLNARGVYLHRWRMRRIDGAHGRLHINASDTRLNRPNWVRCLCPSTSCCGLNIWIRLRFSTAKWPGGVCTGHNRIELAAMRIASHKIFKKWFGRLGRFGAFYASSGSSVFAPRDCPRVPCVNYELRFESIE